MKFGFVDHQGIAHAYAKMRVKISEVAQIDDIVLIQYDMSSRFHFTLHYSSKDGQPSEYHMQAERPEIIAEEDRAKFPDVIAQHVPGPEELEGLWFLQAVPFFSHIAPHYPEMTPTEQGANGEGLADFRQFDEGTDVSGLLEVYLAQPGDVGALRAKRQRVAARGLASWRVIDDIRPWILAYSVCQNVPNMMPP